MKIPFLSRNQHSSSPPEDQDHIFKTVNSIFFYQEDDSSTSFTNSSSQSARLSLEDEESYDNMDTMIIGGLNSERLFYDPHGTRSLLRVREPKTVLPFEEESVALAMESADPYRDFRKSMEEMMEIHGLKDWDSWEELLGWYLRMNGKINHGFIVGAFIDLLVRMSPAQSSDSDSTTSISSSSRSPVTRQKEKLTRPK
ncbi:transcription repressor OFP13-like [Impatiens glandulifera]|uniref:transcription repressor OFP13-like n=1 Tax=Impatiens glandulifera TaxID=253017 RepID=UPI001FB18AC0|nr:transcription repressor OFP13-like [Impatiens glandulifera]